MMKKDEHLDFDVGVATTPESLLAEVQESTLAIARVEPELLRELVGENLDGAELNTFDLPRLKVPSGEIPGFSYKAAGNEDVFKTVTGIMIHKEPCRSYWAEGLEEGGGGSPPSCSSSDGKIGKGDPGGTCRDCPLNEFKSAAKGDGKACKEQRAVFILRDDELLPMLLMLPPTSVGALGQYMLALMSDFSAFWQVRTEFSLEAAQSKSGVAYKVVRMKNAGKLSESDIGRMRAYRNAMIPALQAADVVEAAAAEARDQNGGLQ